MSRGDSVIFVEPRKNVPGNSIVLNNINDKQVLLVTIVISRSRFITYGIF